MIIQVSLSTLSSVIPQATTNEMHVPSSNFSMSMNEFDSITQLTLICNDNNILKSLFQPNELIPLSDNSLEGLKEWEEELRQLMDILVHGIAKVNFNY